MKNNNTWISDILSSDGYIVLNKSLIKKIGLNTTAFICELCGEFRYYQNNEKLVENEWFYSTIPNIEENTGLTRYQQEECIKKLIEINIISSKIMGMPSKRYFKINWVELEKIIKNDTKKSEKSPKNQGCKKLATKVAKNSQARMQKTDKQGCKKLTSKVVKNSQARLQETDKQGCKKLATNNNNKSNNNNNKLTIIKKNNNLLLPTKIDDEFLNLWYNLAKKYKNLNNEKTIIFNKLDQYITNLINSKKKYIMIAGEKIDIKTIIDKIRIYTENDFDCLIDNLSNAKTKIHNKKAYYITSLYNIEDTKDIYNDLKENKKSEYQIKIDEYNKWFKEQYLKEYENMQIA